jgi:hypothetical protein
VCAQQQLTCCAESGLSGAEPPSGSALARRAGGGLLMTGECATTLRWRDSAWLLPALLGRVLLTRPPPLPPLPPLRLALTARLASSWVLERPAGRTRSARAR